MLTICEYYREHSAYTYEIKKSTDSIVAKSVVVGCEDYASSFSDAQVLCKKAIESQICDREYFDGYLPGYTSVFGYNDDGTLYLKSRVDNNLIADKGNNIYTVKTKGSSLNVRGYDYTSEPPIDKVIDSIPNGSKVCIPYYDENDEYQEIIYKGGEGHVSSKYLEPTM